MFLGFLLSFIHNEANSFFFRNLYEKYRAKMQYAAELVLKDADHAEDVVQDIFLLIATQEKVLKRLMALYEESEVYVSHYVIKMCKYEALRKLSKAAFQRELSYDMEAAMYLEEKYVDMQESVNPEELLCKAADLAFVAKAISRLSPDDEMLIELLYFQEFTMEETAAQLKITKNALYVRHHRALKSLACILKQEA